MSVNHNIFKWLQLSKTKSADERKKSTHKSAKQTICLDFENKTLTWTEKSTKLLCFKVVKINYSLQYCILYNNSLNVKYLICVSIFFKHKYFLPPNRLNLFGSPRLMQFVIIWHYQASHLKNNTRIVYIVDCISVCQFYCTGCICWAFIFSMRNVD